MKIQLLFFVINVSLINTLLSINTTPPDSIPPDTIKTKTITNYIIKCDTLQTDTVINYYIYNKRDTVLTDTNVIMINYSGNTTKDTVTLKTKVVKPTYWKFGGDGMIHFSQTSMYYWVEGGENAISMLTGVNLFARYSKNKISWDNFVQLKNGQLKTESTDGFRKNEDKLEINSKFGHKAYKNLYYSFLAEFKTQLFNGYEYIQDTSGGYEKDTISMFMAPANVILAIGMDYKYKSVLSVLVSPLSGKFTFVSDTNKIKDYTTYGLDKGEKMKKELGAYIKIQYVWDITKNIQFENKLDLFSNYLKDPQNIDINLESYLIMRINKYISTKISSHLIYDNDIEIPVFEGDQPVIDPNTGEQKTFPHVQFKEIFSVGFSYKF
ncbi:MAG: DUF3078 domain-containing protein [Marinilabiliales bacterium]